MIKAASALSLSGLKDWLYQRISALILSGYFIYLFAYILMSKPVQYEAWSKLFSIPSMKAVTVITFLALVVHAWVGVWTVATDYIKNVAIRFGFLTLVVVSLFINLLWLIEILWGK